MKLKSLTLGLLAYSGYLAFGSVLNSPAAAQCVQADVSIQYNISGSRQPTKRSNDVAMESQDGCVGNASFTTGVQGNVGGRAPVEQRRQVRHRQSGSSGNPTGVNVPPVQVRSNVGVDVYNPVDNMTNFK
jgi:hypothetical protein